MLHEKAGVQNTDKTLEIAFAYARQNDISHVVVASTRGFTAERILESCDVTGLNVVIVTHNTGFAGDGKQEFSEELRERLVKKGIRVYTGTMVLRSLGASMRDFTGYSEQDLVAHTLRMFSQGIKVCVEIAAMAADGGLIPFTDVVTVAGTSKGADTACLVAANSSNRFFKIKVRGIIIKPKEF